MVSFIIRCIAKRKSEFESYDIRVFVKSKRVYELEYFIVPSYPKKIQTEHGETVISIPRDRNGQFEPIVGQCCLTSYFSINSL